MEVRLPRTVATVIYEAACLGPTGVKQKRFRALEEIKKRAARLQGKEDELHKKLHPDVQG